LARGAVFLLNVVQELRKHGCKIVTVSEGVDFEGPWAVPILATLGTAAEIELEAQRDRMAGARAKAEAAGKRWGRPVGPTEDRTAELEVLLEAMAEGLTLRQAAEMAGLTYGTAQRMVAAARQAEKESK
jgi:DNA invertase Pin-like site-specific DNA recombinase